MNRTLAVTTLLLILTGITPLRSQVLAAQPTPLKPGQIRIAYIPPANPEHQSIYEMVQGRHVLERLRDYLRPLRLPRRLLLKTEGCDGDANAWFEESDESVTTCYEYLAEILANAPEETTPAGVTRQDAVVGPAIEVFLHEIGHAVFSMLKVPILGREEDAADQVASYLLLQLDKDTARRTVLGVGYMYNKELQSKTPGMKQFADVHGLPAQRFYNLLCMAFGANPELFADLVQGGYLPESRSEGCADEYRQVDYAMGKLITPYIDKKLKNDPARKKLLRPAGN